MSKRYLLIVLVFILAISAVNAQNIADDAAISYENQNIPELSTVSVDDVSTTDILQEGEHARINIKNDTYDWEISVLDDDDNPVTEGDIFYSFENSGYGGGYDLFYGNVVFSLYSYYDYFPDNVIFSYGGNYQVDNLTISIDKLPDTIVASDVVDESTFSATFYDVGGNVLVGEDVSFWVYNDDYSNSFYCVTGSDGVAVIDPLLPVGNYTVQVQNIVSGQSKEFWWNITELDESKIVTINAYQKGKFLVVYVVDKDGNNVTSGSFTFVSEMEEYGYDGFYNYPDFVEFNLYNFDVSGYPQNISIEFTSDDYYPANTTIFADLVDTIVASDVVDESTFSATFYDVGGNVLVGEDVSFWVYNDDYSNSFYCVTGSDGVAVIDPLLPVGNYTVQVQNIVSGQSKEFWWNITELDESKLVTINAYQKGKILVVYVVDKDGNNVTSGSFTFVSEMDEYGYEGFYNYQDFVEFNLYNFDVSGYPQNISIEFTSDDYYPANTTIFADLVDTIVASDVVDESTFSATFYDDNGVALNERQIRFVISNGDNSYWKSEYYMTDSDGVFSIDLTLPIDNYTVWLYNEVTNQEKYYKWNITKLDDSKYVDIRASQKGNFLVISAVDKNGNNVTSGGFRVGSDTIYNRDEPLNGNPFVSFSLVSLGFENYPQNVTINFYSNDFYPANSSIYVDSLIDTIVASDVVDESSFSAKFYDNYGNVLDNKELYISVINEESGYWNTFYPNTDLNGMVSISPALQIGNYYIELTNPVTNQKKFLWWNITKLDKNKMVEIRASQSGSDLIISAVDSDGYNVTGGRFVITSVLGESYTCYVGQSAGFYIFNLYDFNMESYSEDIKIGYYNDNYYYNYTNFFVKLNSSIIAHDVFNESSFSYMVLDKSGNLLNGSSSYVNIYNGDGKVIHYLYPESDSNGNVILNLVLEPDNYTVEIYNHFTYQRESFWWNVTDKVKNKESYINVTYDGYVLRFNVLNESGYALDGRITIYVNNEEYREYSVDSSDLGYCIVYALGEGTYKIDLYFDGNPYYYGSNASLTVDIKDTIEINDTFYNTTNCTVQMFDYNGNPAENIHVRFIVDNINFEGVTDKNGYLTSDFGLKPGIYEGSVYNLNSSQMKSFKMEVIEEYDYKKAVLHVSCQGYIFTINATNMDGNIIEDGIIYIEENKNGRTFKIENGTLKLSYSDLYVYETEGNVTLTFVLKHNYYYPANATCNFKVSDTITFDNYQKGNVFNATFFDMDGNPLVNKEVNFLFYEGYSYIIKYTANITTKTDEFGFAYVRIDTLHNHWQGIITNLETGQYKTGSWVNHLDVEITPVAELIDNSTIFLPANTKTLQFEFSPNATGRVTTYGTIYSTDLIKNGTVTINITDSIRVHSFELYYMGDGNFDSASKYYTVIVGGIYDPQLSVSENIVVDYSKDVNFTVNLMHGEKPISNASVEISIGNNTFNEITDENGTIIIPFTSDAGIYDVSVIYKGNVTYAPVNKTTTITINKINATINVNESVIDFANPLVVNVDGDATGQIIVEIDGNKYSGVISNNYASIDLSNLAKGNYDAIINYLGDNNYNNCTINEKITINPVEAELNVTANPISVGDVANVEIKLPEDASGNVTVGNVTVPVVNGTAIILISGLAVGDNPFNVTYSGDDKYNSIETNVTVSVKKIDTFIEVEQKSLNLTVGDNESIIASVVPSAAGNITYTSNNESVVSVDAEGNVIAVGEGNAVITLSFAGDDIYNASENKTLSVSVNSKETIDSNISVSAEDIVEGEVANVVVLLPGDATGNVTIILNGESKLININDTTVRGLNGVLSMLVTYNDLLAGNYTVVAIYSGDDKYNSANATVSFEVAKATKENVTVNVTADSVSEGENVSVAVTLPKDATGNVTAVVDGKTYSSPVENGTATIIIPGLAAGNYTVPVIYSGDEKYNPVTKDVAITVNEDTSDIISAPDVVKYFKGPERFVINVTDYKGNPIANKSVNITINGVTYGRKTGDKGTTSIAIGLSSGEYTATVTVDNTTINSKVTVLTTVNGTDVVKVFRNGTQYYATFRDSEGNYLKDGTVVRFNIHGVMYDRKVSGSEGLAKLNINLGAGDYIITAINPETGEMSSNNITVISRLIENRDITKYYRNATQYTIKVIGDDGNPVGAGEIVTFNINGVFYTRQTNASGIAKLNINLGPGNYIITAIYKECMVSNNIKVLPVLFAEDLVKKYGTSDQFRVLLLDGQGNPFPNQIINFNINGVFYSRLTDVDGYAKLNIRLGAAVDEYIITSTYNGTSISNKIIIVP